jgi:hypothetical protein
MGTETTSAAYRRTQNPRVTKFFYGIMGSQRNQSRKLEINKTPQQPFDILKQETIIGNSMLLVLPIIFSPDTGGICDERNQTTVFDW